MVNTYLGYVEPTNGQALVWSASANAYVPTTPGSPAAHAASHNLGGSDALAFPCRVLSTFAPTLTGSVTTPVTSGIVNTTAETDAFSIVVPAASVAAGDVLVFDLGMDIRQASGGNVDYTFKFKLGATTFHTSGAITLATNNNRYYRHAIRATILLASLTDQRISVTDMGTLAGSGAGLSAGGSLATVATAAENLATDKTFAMTVTMSVANANADARPVFGTLTRYR